MGRRKTRTENMSLILKQIWYHDGISRIEISDKVGLNKSTVTNLVTELILLGVLEEREQKETNNVGGRKPIALGLNKNYGIVLGLGVQAEMIRAVAVDIAGDIVFRWKKETGQITRRNIIDVFLESFDELSASLMERGFSNLLGIGLGAGGIINPLTGVVEYSIPLSIYEPFPLCEVLSRHINAPVYIENDSNCGAWMELAFGKANSPDNFLFVLVEFKNRRQHIKEHGGIGIGFGIVLDGKLHYGNTFSAGEFRSAFSRGEYASQMRISPEDLHKLPEDKAVMDRFLDELFANIACIVNVLNISHVYLGGDIELLGDSVCDMLTEYIMKNWMYPLPVHCNVKMSSLHEFAVAYGAAGMILDRIFRNDLHDSFWQNIDKRGVLPALIRHPLPIVSK
ncbi:ROK family transcriptional regulator [Spirochaetia bacterium 38H-sp]|uniref:ROK family transcriptional regulator n=1 Tax=Rarispira pelagica TaxID=3141764 RepID=A0ABU9U8G2_9SPIR